MTKVGNVYHQINRLKKSRDNAIRKLNYYERRETIQTEDMICIGGLVVTTIVVTTMCLLHMVI